MANVFDTSSTGGVNFFDTWDATSGGVAITVITATDNCNIEPSTVVITDPTGVSPQVTVTPRPATCNVTAGLFRHFFFAVDNAEGKTPTFRVNWSAIDTGGTAAGWRAVYTQDFVTWTQANAHTDSGGYRVFSFPAAMPPGAVYISSNITGRQAESIALAADLLTNHSSVASPLPSADSGGVFAVSPAETDDLGRSVGGNDQFAIKLAWGGPTNDGRRKRIMVWTALLHAAGESQAWPVFTSSLDWMMNSASSEAVAMRANFDLHLYFNVNANGQRGGNSRGSYSSSVDFNRDFANGSHVEIANLKSAMILDTGGSCDVHLDFHGDAYQSDALNAEYCAIDENPLSRGVEAGAFIDNLAVTWGRYPTWVISTPDNTSVWFSRYVLGAAVGAFCESPAFGLTTKANYDTTADNWMRAVAMTDAAGHFAKPYVRQQQVANLGRTNATRYYQAPAPSNYWIPASTDFSVVMRVRKGRGASFRTPCYLLTCGTFGSADSLVILTGSDPGEMSFTYNSGVQTVVSGAFPEEAWVTLALSRIGTDIKLKYVTENSGVVLSSAASTSSAKCNFPSMFIGARDDLDLQRSWRGAIDSAFIITGDSVTDGELIDIAAGNVRIPPRVAGVLIFDLPGINDANGALTEQVQSVVIPLSGTGYPLEDAPLPASLVLLEATSGGVTVTGNTADLLTGELFDNAVSGAVSVSGTTGTLISSGAYDAIKGVISIQAKPATSILQASTATKDIVYVVGKLADLVDGAAEVFNATTAQITIAGKTAEAVAVMMQALPDNVIIRGNNAEFVQYAILDAISGSVNIAGLPAELREGAEPTDAIAAALRVLGVSASINDTMIIIPHRSRVLIIKGSGL